VLIALRHSVNVVGQIESLFPNQARISFVRNRPVFSLVDGSATMPISICHCHETRVQKLLRWVLRVPRRDRHLTTLVCLSNLTCDGFEAFYVVQGVEIGAKCTIKGDGDPLLPRGQQLNSLADLCTVARTIDQKERCAEDLRRSGSFLPIDSPLSQICPFAGSGSR